MGCQMVTEGSLPQIFVSFYLKMDEGKKRSLRNRRPPNYLVTESEDPELYGYARPHYSKEYVSPGLELNAAAKLLTKFINSANKRIRDMSRIDEAEERPDVPLTQPNPDKSAKKTSSAQDQSRKKYSSKPLPKDEPARNPKDLYSFKDQHSNPSGTREINKFEETFTREWPANKSSLLQAGDFSLSDPHYLAFVSQMTSQQRINAGIVLPDHLQAATKAINHQQFLLLQSPMFRQKVNLPPPPARSQTKDKLFGRAAYHVAIAYHIHLQKMGQARERGEVTMMDLDPTYQAKKLKSQQERGQEEPRH